MYQHLQEIIWVKYKKPLLRNTGIGLDDAKVIFPDADKMLIEMDFSS